MPASVASVSVLAMLLMFRPAFAQRVELLIGAREQGPPTLRDIHHYGLFPFPTGSGLLHFQSQAGLYTVQSVS